MIMDIAHNPDGSFSVIMYSDNLQTFEAGVRNNILRSALGASKICYEAGISVYIERRARA